MQRSKLWAMGGVKSLLFGPTWEDVDVLNQTYGAPPSQFITLPNGERSISETRVRRERSHLFSCMATARICTHGIALWSVWLRNSESSGDLRRHGLTGPASDDGYSIERYVADLAMVVDHLGLERFVLLGHSWGGEFQSGTPWNTKTGSAG